ncbi:MAG TPA: SdrD B-like domain-containing protein [Anaerolineales bacterium]|nr:SdrD B-like domain-containing protein [Anaerolineales bacterium]
MKRLLNLSLLSSFLLALVLVPLYQTKAEPALQSGNLLKNPGFEGQPYFKDGIPQLEIPGDWEFWFKNGGKDIAEQSTPWGRPEVNVRTRANLGATDSALFIRDGDKTLKVFLSWQSIWWGLKQTVAVTPGTKYRFNVPVYPDLVTTYSPQKTYADVNSGSNEMRLIVRANGANIADSGYVARNSGAFTDLAIEFTATTNQVEVEFEARAKYGLVNNGWWIDGVSLIAVGAGTVPTTAPGATTAPGKPAPTQAPVVVPPTQRPAPTAFTLPTPAADGIMYYTVQEGDSLIRIATIACGETLICLEKLKAANKLTSNVIYLGQTLIVGPFGADGSIVPGAPGATPTQQGVSEPATNTPGAEATAGQPPTTDPNAVPTTDPNAQPTAEPPTATPEPTQIPPTVAPTQALAGTGEICVTFFEDLNGNGLQEDSELPQTDAVVSLLDFASGAQISSYTTNGVTEPYCFSDLALGTYRVVITTPAGYTPTTGLDLEVPISAGGSASLKFGGQKTGDTATPEPTDNSGSNRTRLITALLGAFGVIFLLLAIGVAVYLIIAQRRRAQDDEDEE